MHLSGRSAAGGKGGRYSHLEGKMVDKKRKEEPRRASNAEMGRVMSGATARGCDGDVRRCGLNRENEGSALMRWSRLCVGPSESDGCAERELASLGSEPMT